VPVSNLQSRFEQSASEHDSADADSDEISFTALNDEQFFDQIVLKFPRLQRFKDAWLFSGNFNPATMVLAYNPKSFVEDLQRDIANLDRPSAHNLAVFVMEQFATCSEFSASLRRDWAAGYTALSRQKLNLPGLEVVHVEDDGVRGVGKVHEVPLLSDSTSNVRELKQFVAALSNQVHNSETVFGVDAGFTVVPHEEILEALRESAEAAKAANGNSSANKVQVTWQRLSKWTRESWLAFERKWWDSVNQSVQNGQYLKMQNLIDTDLFNDMQQDLKIHSLQWFKFSEIEFLRRAHGWHGPVNKEDALLLLSDHQCVDTFRTYNPENFLTLLSNYNTKFLRTIDLEIAPAISKWPKPGQPKYGPLSLKSIRKAFQHGFSKFKSTSKGCSHCFDVCEQNPHLSHQQLYQELRSHFLYDVEALRRPTLQGGSLDVKRSDGGSARGRSDGGSARDRANDSFQERDRNGRFDGGSTPRNKRPRDNVRNPDRSGKPKTEFAVVQGKDRCWCCGDYTNHYGSGASAETCLAFGTRWAKKKGYTWKNSEQEPKVQIPNDDFQALRARKPEVVKRNSSDRVALRNKANSSYSLSSSLIDVVQVDVNPHSQLFDCRPIYSTHDGDTLDELPAFPVHVDVTEVVVESSDRRFFGLAAFPTLVSTVPADDRPRLTLLFSRDIAAGAYKRRPRKFQGCVSSTAHFNAISPEYLKHKSIYGKLKRLDTPQTPRPEPLSSPSCECALLSFKVELISGAMVSDIVEWFLLDANIPDDMVILNSEFMQQAHMERAVITPAKLPINDIAMPSIRSAQRVLFDSGAQMSCISPAIAANHVILERTPVNIAIIQLGNVVARCHEKIFMSFELFSASMKPTTYSDWFLVWNNPYGIIIGADICNEIVSWRSVLAEFTPSNVSIISGNANTQLLTSNPWDQPTEHSKILAIKRRFQSRHPVTHRALRNREAGTRPQFAEPNDHSNVRKSAIVPGIFTESARREPESLLCRNKEKRLMSIINSIPAEHRVAFDIAELQHECIASQFLMHNQILKEIRGLPEGLKMHGGASAIVKRAHLFEPHQPSTALYKPTPEIAAHTWAMRFLLQKAIASGADNWSWSADDEYEYNGRSYISIDAADVIASTPEGSFANGATVSFVSCVRLQHFNGMRGRLYALQDDGRWQVRVLGKNQGNFVLAHPKNLQVELDQRQFVSSVDANFNTVGIDDSGMPLEDIEAAPRPVHRQFGKAYSTALTARIQELLAKYKSLFDDDISVPCDFEEMDIVLKPNAILPNRARYYKNTPAMREEVRRQVQEQLDMGIIEKAQSPVVSNVLLVKRPHMPGRYRFVVDYQKINDATVPDQLMMPDIKTQHDRLANKLIFGAIDIRSYYRLINLKASCRYLTAFATDEGVFVYNRVAMGLRNACSHAQRVLQEKLAADPILGVRGANIRNYFDDIAWGCSTEDEFMTVLQALLEFGIKHRLKYNLEKSCFGVDSITHVGFIANKDGIKIDPERTRDIVELEAPKSTKKVQSILGVLNFVRNFIPQFSVKAKFLTDRLEKSAIKRDSKKFEWSPGDAAAFVELKQLVLAAPLLSILDYTKPIYIRCDSSRFGCGAVLFQFDDQGRELPVCYASRKYTPAETRYSTFQQEMGAVVWSLERFMEYTQGYHVIVETDHRNIAYVKRSIMPQLARWRMRLEAFDFEVHYRCGPQQEVADGLSRSAVDEAGVDDVAVCYGDVLPKSSTLNAAPMITLDTVNVDTLACDSRVYDDSCSDTRVSWQTAADEVFVDPFSASDDDSENSNASSDNSDDEHAADAPNAAAESRTPLN
jgi:hypothetical protein